MSAEILEPLEPAREIPRPKRCACRCAAVALLLAAAAAGVYWYLRVRLRCHIDGCQELQMPSNALSCSAARCLRCAEGRAASVDSEGGFCGFSCTLPHCSGPVLAQRHHSCESRLSCPSCVEGYELELDPTTLEPTGNCSFVCAAAQREAGCAPRSCTPTGCTECVPGFRSSGLGCAKVESATEMSFYMYRAQSKVEYPPENCDLASAAGVMWYLHNEVVKLCPRHYDITRVLRYKVTVFNPASVFAVRAGQFGHFVQFDFGQCTVPDCATWWAKYGYAVGCQRQDETRWKYPDSFWYSLPGRCPSQTWSNKSDACVAEELGGNCSQPNGTQACTWRAEPAGEVSVDVLSGIKDLDAFCAAGHVEYDEKTDKGRGCSFWDDKFNESRNKERVLALQRHFLAHGPFLHEPWCDGF